MRIGILSDSHGQAARTQAATRMLLQRGVDLLIHLGDIGTDAVIDALIERLDADGRPDPPVHIVFGNTDANAAAMQRYAESLGVHVDHPAGRIDADGKVVVFTHGHLPEPMYRSLDEVDYLLHGHTHLRRDERSGRTRVINPGALQRAAEHTVALLDTATDELEFLRVDAERA
ncbi:MAG: YfcE family phosphodiesterase [Phycisphaera sp.]|nr:YfcE family phosphodiesterase [Phycisphaera sp.]